MNIAAIIPTYNNDALFVLLQQLRRQSVKVIVIDNGCDSDCGLRIRSGTEDVDYLRLPENSGGSGGFIAGVEYALKKYPEAEYLWLLDDDVIIKDDTLDKLFEAVAELDSKNIKWGAIASMMLEKENPDIVTETGAAVNWWKTGLKAYNRGEKANNIESEVLAIEYGAAASLLVKPAVIRETGFFENVFIHFDDVDWCYRLRKAGYEIYCATASKIWHPTNRSKPATWVRYYDARNFIWLCMRHNKKFLPWAVFLLMTKGLYFYFHGLRMTAYLYFSGICNAFSGKLFMRNELQYEGYCSVDNKILQESNIICIFNNSDSFKSFQVNYCPRRIVRAFIYEPNLKGEHKFIRIISKFIYGLKAFLYSLFFSKSNIIVMDDAFRNNFMFPVMLKNKMIYNHYLDKFVNL